MASAKDGNQMIDDSGNIVVTVDQYHGDRQIDGYRGSDEWKPCSVDIERREPVDRHFIEIETDTEKQKLSCNIYDGR